MKKILIVLLVLVILIAAAGGIFFATFDANRYKGLITENLTKALGRPVEIDKVSLKWNNGVALEVLGLKVYSGTDINSAVGIQLASASANMRILPLLQKNIQIASILLSKPSVRIVRKADGSILVGGIEMSKQQVASASGSQDLAAIPASHALLLSVDSIAVRDGNIVFEDLALSSPSKMETRDLDLAVKNFSLSKPFEFEVALSFLSSKQNIKLSGKALLPGSSSAGSLESVRAEVNLSELDVEALARACPALGKSAVIGPFGGVLTAVIDRVNLGADALSTLKGKIEFKQGKFSLRQPALPVENIDLIADIAGGKASFQILAQILSGKQNLKAKGRAQLPANGIATVLEGLTVQTSLSDLDIRKIESMFPGLAAAGLKENPSGDLSIQFDHLSLDPASIASAKGKITFQNGRVVLASMNGPIEHIDAVAVVGNDQAQLDHLTADFSGANLKMEALATGLKAAPIVNIKGILQNLPIGEFVKAANPNAPQLSGHANIELDAQGTGLSWQSISSSLNGRTRLTINDGVLLNYNVLTDVINKISVIPGAESAFKANFPQMYQKRLEEKSTLLKPLDVTANIVGGTFIFDSIQVDTDFALLNGSGQVGMDRRLGGRANLILSQEISKALAGAFSPLEVLYNNGKQIVIPVALEGQIPQVKIAVDKQYVTSKLLSGQTQGLVQGLVTDPGGSVDKIESLFKKSVKGLKI